MITRTRSAKNQALLLPVILFSILLIFGCSSSKTISGASPEQIRQAIRSDRWVFVAQSAIAQGGRSRQIDTRYDVRFGRDTIQCYLPYFGRSFSGAGAFSSGSPLDFKSTDISIEKEELKNGGTRLKVKPRDISSVQFMIFEIFESGSSSLSVTLTDRSPISFNGYIEAVK
jgi:hypothetical protein